MLYIDQSDSFDPSSSELSSKKSKPQTELIASEFFGFLQNWVQVESLPSFFGFLHDQKKRSHPPKPQNCLDFFSYFLKWHL